MEDPLHREILEEHARSPSHQGALTNPTGQSKWTSPKTGNICSVEVLVEEGRLKEVCSKVEGSALAVSCSSLMGAAVEGLSLVDVVGLAESLVKYLEHGTEFSLPCDLAVYQSIKRFPERYDCALLAWRALRFALDD